MTAYFYPQKALALMQELERLNRRLDRLRAQSLIGMYSSAVAAMFAPASIFIDGDWPLIVVLFLVVFSIGMSRQALRQTRRTIREANAIADQILALVPRQHVGALALQIMQPLRARRWWQP